MEQFATVRVAITALSDVQREREAVVRAIEDLNHGIAAQCGLRLESYVWEMDVSTNLPAERARRSGALLQEIEDCDIAIAIFCTSLGAPATGTNSEQEFRRAYASWKKSGKPHLLVYFSQEALTPTSEDADAWERMQRFRREFPPDLLRWDYKSTAEFDHLVRRQLTEYLVSRSALPPVEESHTSAQSRENVLRELEVRREVDGEEAGHIQVEGPDLSQRTREVTSKFQDLKAEAQSSVSAVDAGASGAEPLGTRPALDAETFGRLSPSTKGALGRAEGMRVAMRLPEVHMEQLIVGLFENYGGPTERLLQKAKIDELELRKIIHEIRDKKIPTSSSPVSLNAFPPFSEHAAKAMQAAVQRSAERQSKLIRSRHLLYGALSVEECGLVRALADRGVRKEELDELAEPDQSNKTQPATSTAVQPVEVFYSFSQRDLRFRKPLEKYLGILQQQGLVKSWSGLSISAGDRAGDVADRLNSAQLILLLVSPDYLQNRSNVSEMERAVERQRKGEARVVPVILRPIGFSEAEFPITGLPTLPEGRVTVSEFANYDEGFRNVAEGLRRILPTITVTKPSTPTPTPTPVLVLNAAPTPKVDSDLWSTKDCLGYEAYARTIASLITHPDTKPPLTIGIKAPWGAGKTSLMKRVQHLLDGYAPLSEQGRVGILQQMLPPEVTLKDLLKELKSGSKPEGPNPVPAKNNPYNLPTRITVWFNAWKYQTSEQVWAGMAHCIISQVTARMGVKERELFWLRLHGRRVNAEEVRKRVYRVVLEKMVPMAAGVVALCAIAFWLAAVLPIDVSGWWPYSLRGASLIGGAYWLRREWFSKLGEKAAETMSDLVREPAYEGKMGYLHLVESDMREMLQLATEKSVTKEKPNGDPLVVFVDDLDRCAPNKVAEVVEAINLFLCGDYPNCIFVLGMEPGMVAAALEVANKDVIEKAQKLGLVDRTAPVGWRFMEKIVQLPIVIPPPTDNDRLGYVGSLTGLAKAGGKGMTGGTGPTPTAPAPAPVMRPERHGEEEEAKVQSYIQKIGTAKSSAEAAQKAVAVGKEAPAEERWAALEAGNRVYEQALTGQDPVMAEFANRLSPLVEGNPRQIKRYVNVYRFYSTLRYRLGPGAEVPREDLPSAEVLARFVELSIRWPHAIDCLRVRVDNGNGAKVSLLKKLETESRKLESEASKRDEAWKKLVGNDGLGLPEWVQERAFREFLSSGQLLCETEGHGLW